MRGVIVFDIVTFPLQSCDAQVLLFKFGRVKFTAAQKTLESSFKCRSSVFWEHLEPNAQLLWLRGENREVDQAKNTPACTYRKSQHVHVGKQLMRCMCRLSRGARGGVDALD